MYLYLQDTPGWLFLHQKHKNIFLLFTYKYFPLPTTWKLNYAVSKAFEWLPQIFLDYLSNYHPAIYWLWIFLNSLIQPPIRCTHILYLYQSHLWSMDQNVLYSSHTYLNFSDSCYLEYFTQNIEHVSFLSELSLNIYQ